MATDETDNTPQNATAPEPDTAWEATQRRTQEREDARLAQGAEAVSRMGGGDLRSDPPTIAAIREGVRIRNRLASFVVEDHNGDHHESVVVLESGQNGHMTVRVLDKIAAIADERAATPRRRKGDVHLADMASFISYVNRMRRSGTTVGFAQSGSLDDEIDPSVTVIFDFDEEAESFRKVGEDYAHVPNRTGWRADRASYTCELSRQWKAWSEQADVAMSQEGFGDWIEAHASDVTVPKGGKGPDGKPYPDATSLQVMALKLVVNAGVKVKREINPTTGTSSAVFETTHGDDSTTIYPAFVIGVPVFEGSDTLYEVECRVRFTLDRNTGRPSFTYTLHNAAQVYQGALKKLREQIASECTIPVYVGSAPPPAGA